jgi:hypothetical protein
MVYFSRAASSSQGKPRRALLIACSQTVLTVHYQWIDAFPRPRMRDNLIKMIGLVDEGDLMLDLFTKPSFTIRPGTASWDPRGWKLEKLFTDKWGFVFFGVTNPTDPDPSNPNESTPRELTPSSICDFLGKLHYESFQWP